MMRNKEVLNEIRKQSRTLIEEKRDKFVKQSLLSDEFIDMMQSCLLYTSPSPRDTR